MALNLKAFKYRIYPDQEQKTFLDKTFGCVRFVWNKMVAAFNSFSSFGPNRTIGIKELKADGDYGWLNDAIACALYNKQKDFFDFKQQYFNKKRKKPLGRPKFKKRGGRESFRIPAKDLGYNKCIDFVNGTIKLPKMKPIKMIISQEFNGEIKSVTVSKNPSGQYFVSILVNVNIELKQNTGRSVGIDLGLDHLLTTSDGVKIDNPRLFRENQSKLKNEQKHLSRKKKGSNRYKKQRLKVARMHQYIVNCRKDLLHNISTWLVLMYDVIVLEDLNIAGMKKNHKLAKSISDVSWSMLVSMIEYKCKWYGKTFHKIDRYFASSKTCSCCGHKLETLPLSIRSWECPSCGVDHDRDLNASVNILNEGLQDLYGLQDLHGTSAVLVDYRRGDVVRPGVTLPLASSVNRLFTLCQ